MQDPTLLSIAAKTGKTPAQVLIRWSLQHGFVPLPKSDTPSRIAENADVFDFELDGESMARLDRLDLGKEGARPLRPLGGPGGFGEETADSDAGACQWNPVDHA